MCMHCGRETGLGTHGGCLSCGKVQTPSGKIDRVAMRERQRRAQLRFGMTARQRVEASGALVREG